MYSGRLDYLLEAVVRHEVAHRPGLDCLLGRASQRLNHLDSSLRFFTASIAPSHSRKASK